MQVFTCHYQNYLMSRRKHEAKDKRIDLGIVRFKKDNPLVALTNEDDIYRLVNFETGFFKVKYDISEVNAANECGTSNAGYSSRSRDVLTVQAREVKKIGDVCLYVICINPTTGKKNIIRTEIK